MYQVIARKYRPQRFDEIIGQDHITKTLQNAIVENRLHHAYLFTGIRGIGKTTLARIFSKILNCADPLTAPPPEPCNKCQSCLDITNGSSLDVQEIDGASNTGVDDVREIRERVKFLPASGKYKIYIIDEVHMLSTPAFNALLKTLEEPPAHVIFIFATTESQKIPATILSRCQRYDFRRITNAKIVEALRNIAKSEGVDAEDESLAVIAVEAEGSMRDAESLFDQAIAYAGKKLAYSHLKELLGFLDRRQINAAVSAIVEKNADALLAISEELFGNGENLNRFATELMNRFHDLLVLKTCKDIPHDAKLPDADILKDLAKKVTLEECQQWFNMLYRGVEDIARTKLPKVMLDVLLINLTLVKPLRSVDELLEKVEQLKGNPAPLSQTQATSRKLPVASHQSPVTGHDAWPPFIEWLRLNKPQVASFLESSTGGIIEGSAMTIRFDARSFASDRIMEADRKAFLEKLASDFFKRPLKIDVRFDEPEKDAPAEKRKNHEETMLKHKGIKEEALKHDVIRNAANIFGAEIKEVKVKT